MDIFGRNEKTQRITDQQIKNMEHLSGETLEDARKKLTKEKLDNILFNKSKGGSPYVVNPNDSHINEDSARPKRYHKKGDITKPFILSRLEQHAALGFHDYVRGPTQTTI